MTPYTHRFGTEWNSPSEQTVKLGEPALAEMCFFWAHHYPKQPVADALLDGTDLGPILGGMSCCPAQSSVVVCFF